MHYNTIHQQCIKDFSINGVSCKAGDIYSTSLPNDKDTIEVYSITPITVPKDMFITLEAKYVVVRKSNLNEFEIEVNKLLNDGWKLQGNISIILNNDNATIYHQSLIKDFNIQ